MSQGSTISAAPADGPPAVRPHPSFRAPLIMSLILGALMTVIFWDFLRRQVMWATMLVADWGHTLIIPFIAGYFVYMKRHEIMAKPFRTTWIAFVPILLGVMWYMLCVFGPQPLWHHNLRGAGFALTLFGLVLLFFGWRVFWIVLFPLCYLVIFGQTISDRFMEIVTFKLQDITARGAEIVMLLMRLDVERIGNTLFLYEPGEAEPLPLNIAEACSGMRMLMAFLALGVAMAYTGLSRFWQRGLLVLLAVPTAVAVNIIRVVTLAQLGRIDVNFTGGEFHTFVGLVWLVPAFLIYLGLVWIIRHIVVEAPAGRNGNKSSQSGGTKKSNRAGVPSEGRAKPKADH